MSDYTIKIEPDKERVLFHGIDWGYGVGCELPLWYYNAESESGLVVVKMVGSMGWSSRGESSYTPAEFIVLRITEPREGMDGWVRVEQIIRFPIRKPRRASYA